MTPPHYIVGRKFASESYTVEADQIVAFATQFDPQPFHIDAVAATSSLFGRLIASGWHTASLTMKLLVGSGAFAGDDNDSGGTIGAGADVRWVRPVGAGDTLVVTSEIVAIVPMPSNAGRCAVTFRVETLNQRSEIVQAMNAKIVVPKALTAMD